MRIFFSTLLLISVAACIPIQLTPSFNCEDDPDLNEVRKFLYRLDGSGWRPGHGDVGEDARISISETHLSILPAANGFGAGLPDIPLTVFDRDSGDTIRICRNNEGDRIYTYFEQVPSQSGDVWNRYKYRVESFYDGGNVTISFRSDEVSRFTARRKNCGVITKRWC